MLSLWLILFNLPSKEPQQNQGRRGAGCVDQAIVDRARAMARECLMVFIERCIEEGDQQGRERPPSPPARSGPRPEGAEEQQRENGVLGKMSGLTDVKMDRVEQLPRGARIDEADDLPEQRAGVVPGNYVGRKPEDHRHPDYRRRPVLQEAARGRLRSYSFNGFNHYLA